MDAERQKTILLVEDEVLTAMSERMILEKFGYKVITASTGEDAVATIEKAPGIDLILMDINLGKGIDGTEAAEKILKNHDLPVVFLSSHTEPEVVAKTEKITSYGYVVKNSSSTVIDASIKMAFKLFESKIKEKEKESRMATALEALRESEASYRALFSGASDGILLADSQTKLFRYANPAICRMLGYTEKEFLQMSVADIHPKESLDRVLAEFAALARGEKMSTPDLPCLRKNGTLFFANISHSAMVVNGCEYHAGFFHDSTERKLAEEALRLSEAQKNAILDGITANIAFVDKDLKIIWVNKTAAESVKKSPAEMTGLTCHHFWADPSRPCENCPSIKALDTNKSAQTIMHTPDGRVWEERGEPVFDTGGNLIGVVEIASDITGRGRLESQKEAALDALRESEEKYRLLIENSHDIIYTLSSEGVFTFVSPSWTTLLGHTVNQVVGKLFQQFVHPDDFVVCIATIRKVMESGQRQESIEYRVRHADGSWRWHVTNAVPIRDAAGRVVSGEGIARDITERKQAESQKEAALAALRENGSRLDLAMQAANMAWWEMDITTGNVTFAKRKAEMLGFPPEKFKHYKDFTALVHPEDHDRTMAAMRGHIDGIFDKYEVEYRILTKAGEYEWFYDIGSVVKKDAKEKPLNVAGLVINITERKKADEAIKRQLREKEILLVEVHHRIKNNITSIAGLISLRLESISNPEAVAVLQDAISRVNSMRILYDKLLLNEGYKDVSVKNYAESLADLVVALFPENTKIKLDKHISDFQLDPKRLFPLGLIINELITNKMKYAFINKDAGIIKISLKNVKNHVTLTIQDNGNELPGGFDIEQAKGFGLMLVKMLSQQLGGSFSMEKDAGTRCTVEFGI